MTDAESAASVDTGGVGPEPGPPELCLLHLNFQPCPWCEVRRTDPAFEDAVFGEVEAATIDTTPRRRGRPPGSRNRG